MKLHFSTFAKWAPLCGLTAAALISGCGGGTSGVGTPTPTPTGTPGPTPTSTPVTVANTIVFVSDRDGNNEIYSMLGDGSQQRRLTTAPADDSFPARSRDGRRVAFSSQRDGNAEIYVMGIEGESADLQRLTNDSGAAAPTDTSPAFSPDGTRLAWVSTRGAASNIWLMDANGANQRPFTTEDFVSSPAWSPDGTEIAFAVFRAADAVLVVKNVATGAERVVAQGAFSVSDPSYSPNGQQIIFTARLRPENTRELRIVNLSNGAIASGPDAGEFNISPSISPDGGRIVFESEGAPSPQVFIANAPNGAATPLTSAGRNFSPSWGQ